MCIRDRFGLALGVPAGDIPPTPPLSESPGLHPTRGQGAVGLAVVEGHGTAIADGSAQRLEARLLCANARLDADDRSVVEDDARGREFGQRGIGLGLSLIHI